MKTIKLLAITTAAAIIAGGLTSAPAQECVFAWPSAQAGSGRSPHGREQTSMGRGFIRSVAQEVNYNCFCIWLLAAVRHEGPCISSKILFQLWLSLTRPG
jgi:hypothetical protein